MVCTSYLTVQSYGLKWSPKQSSSQKCKDAVKSYEKQLAVHEGKHIQDLKDIVKSANDRWIDKTYSGCGANDQEAISDIKLLL